MKVNELYLRLKIRRCQERLSSPCPHLPLGKPLQAPHRPQASVQAWLYMVLPTSLPPTLPLCLHLLKRNWNWQAQFFDEENQQGAFPQEISGKEVIITETILFRTIVQAFKLVYSCRVWCQRNFIQIHTVWAFGFKSLF